MSRLLPYILLSLVVVWDYVPTYCDTLESSQDLKMWSPVDRSTYRTNLLEIRVPISTNMGHFFRVSRTWRCP